MNVTTQGPTTKTVQEWKAEIEAIYLAADPTWDLSVNTPDGQVIAGLAEMMALQDEQALNAYNANDPKKARGQQLESIMALNYLSKIGATSSTVQLDFTGTDGKEVTSGSIFRNPTTGDEWATDSDTTIAAGVASTTATCTVAGATTAGIADITEIVNPQTGLSTVSNPTVASVGRNEETDAEARRSRDKAVGNTSANQSDSIYAAVSLVENVNDIKAYNNRNDTTDSNGQPRNSFGIIVNGGADEDIAGAMYANLGVGTNLWGASNPTTVAYVSPVTGNTQDITFSRATLINTYVKVTINQLQQLPSVAADDIKQAIVDYANGTLFDDQEVDGYQQQGFTIDDDVNAMQLVTAVNYVLGTYPGMAILTAITVGLAPDPTGAQVVIGFDELSAFDTSLIQVVIS